LDHVTTLASQAGLGQVREVLPLAGGANNRVFRVEAEHGIALLKAYFRHPNDPRDRLAAEYAFSQFAWERGLRYVPQPLACDAKSGLGLYEFVEGARLLPHEITAAAVNEALTFFLSLNRYRRHPDARRLPNASETALSLADHCAILSRRVERLHDIPVSDAIDDSAARFVAEHLLPEWRLVEADIRRRAPAQGDSFDVPLSRDELCLSPSDFGFHNAIRSTAGNWRFIDFEYSGWDDPARMVCDFYFQPAVPIPPETFPYFSSAVAAELGDTGDPGHILRRIDLLLPLYRIKWCCIVLNDFLPVGSHRRRFAGKEAHRERKVGQVAKAQAMLARAVA